MDSETVKYILTIWGAGLSTLLGIIAVIKFRKESRVRLSVTGLADEPFEHIRITACNMGPKPVTVVGYSLSIGMTRSSSKELFKAVANPEKKLSESDIWSVTIERAFIQSLYKEHKIEQGYFERIWVAVILSTGKPVSNMVYINPKLIEKNYYDKAEQFIATDIFLGLPQRDSEAYPIGVK